MEFEPAQDRYEYSLRVRLPICAKTFADGHGSLDTDRRSSPEIQINSEQKTYRRDIRRRESVTSPCSRHG